MVGDWVGVVLDDEVGVGVGVFVGFGVGVGVGTVLVVVVAVVDCVGFAAKVAEIVFVAWMLLKVYEVTAPTDAPLTVTSEM